MQNPRILMAGCGSLGTRVGLALAADYHVLGLRRQAHKVPLPMTPVQADLLKPRQLASALPPADILVYCLTPDQYDEAGYRDAFVTGLDNLLGLYEKREQRPAQVFFVASTAVYGQKNDEWVDETSATNPARYNGQVLLEAEARIAASPIAGTSVRLSGIYGPNRQGMLRSVAEGMVAPTRGSGYSNRIHEDDAVGLLCHLVHKAVRGESLETCYIGSDCEPSRLGDVVAWLREQLPCEPVRDDARAGSRVGSKRCSNQRILHSGYQFLFPSYREGYASILHGKREPRP
ncbi:MAG: NAD-dependent epimerase [Halomonadaceae bacterium]|nr:MAG: NAD-dependent epimerase [Halomonadaceae bacterium]